MVEYKNSDAFETDSTATTAGAYNLEFKDYMRKVIDAFPSLDLHRITLMGEPEKDEEDKKRSPYKSLVGTMPRGGCRHPHAQGFQGSRGFS